MDGDSVVIRIDADDSGFQQALERVRSSIDAVLSGTGEARSAAAAQLSELTQALSDLLGQPAPLPVEPVVDAAQLSRALGSVPLSVPIRAQLDEDGSAYDAGVEVGTAFSQGIQDTESAASTAGSHVASAGANGMKKRSSFYSVGQAMGNGFNSGLASKRGAIIATATSIAQAAAAAMQAALQINSPSKVTMRIGRSVGEGFEMGMAESLHTAIRSAQTIVGDMNLTPREGYSEILDAIGTNTDTVSDAAALQSTRPLNVYFSGRRVSAALASETQKAKNNTERRLKMGIGK